MQEAAAAANIATGDVTPQYDTSANIQLYLCEAV